MLNETATNYTLRTANFIKRAGLVDLKENTYRHALRVSMEECGGSKTQYWSKNISQDI